MIREPVDPAALAHHSTVVELVAAFESAERDVRAAFASIVEAERRINAAFTLGSHIDIKVSAARHWGDDFDDADACIERMARSAWRVIVDRLELRRMMSIRRYADLEKAIKEGPLPSITEENVEAFVRQHVDGFESMFQQAVVEVFEWLRPCRDTYKTNSKFEIGPKVVLERTVDCQWLSRPGFRVEYHQQQKLIALENVFNGLDGKGSVAKSHLSLLEGTICTSPSGRGETDLFAFRAFKNGNLHLTFKRIDLLAKFNATAGGASLKPSSEAA